MSLLEIRNIKKTYDQNTIMTQFLFLSTPIFTEAISEG